MKEFDQNRNRIEYSEMDFKVKFIFSGSPKADIVCFLYIFYVGFPKQQCGSL